MRQTMKKIGLMMNVLFVLAALITAAQPVHGGTSDSRIGIRPASEEEISALGLRTTGALMVAYAPSTGDHGLVAGDVIVFVKGDLVTTLEDLVSKVKASMNSPLDILLYRNKLPKTVQSVLSADMLEPAGKISPPTGEKSRQEKSSEQTGIPRDDPSIDKGESTGESKTRKSGKTSSEIIVVPPDDTSTDTIEYPEDMPPELKAALKEYLEKNGAETVVVEVPEESSAEADTEIQALMQQLRNPDSTERVQAAMELAEYGSAASVALPILIEALKDSESTVRMAAAVGIEGIGVVRESPQIVPVLINMLNREPSPPVRVELIHALSQHAVAGPPAAQAESALQKSLRDKDPRVRKAADEALDLLGM